MKKGQVKKNLHSSLREQILHKAKNTDQVKHATIVCLFGDTSNYLLIGNKCCQTMSPKICTPFVRVKKQK